MKFCDDAKQEECLTPGHCSTPCHHDFSALRRVKPYPEVPPDLYSVQREFEVIGKRLLWAAGAFLAVMFANLLLAFYVMWEML